MDKQRWENIIGSIIIFIIIFIWGCILIYYDIWVFGWFWLFIYSLISGLGYIALMYHKIDNKKDS